MSDPTTYLEAVTQFFFPQNPDFAYANSAIWDAFLAWNQSIYQSDANAASSWADFCTQYGDDVVTPTYNFAGLQNEEDTWFWDTFAAWLNSPACVSTWVTNHLAVLHDAWIIPTPYPGSPY